MRQGRKDSSAPRLTIHLLGTFEVLRDGEPIARGAWRRRKTETLLKILLTEPGTVFSQDQLIEVLFGGENPQKALQNLHARVSELRRALEPELERGVDSVFIVRHGQGYCFNAGELAWIDTVAFENGVRAASQAADASDWMEAADRFGAAVDLYRGDLFSEDRYEEWAEAGRSRLRALYLETLSQLASCCERLGRIRQAISCCQRILRAEPYREVVIRQLMTYQREANHEAQALDTYREGARALREYLDVEPSTETRALRDEIERQRSAEVSLDPRRIAVIPLQNYSPDPEDAYLADGITEELIGSFAKVKDLRVVARTSVMRYKDTTKPVARIARDLNVGTILEGSVRKVGDRIRVSAQLVDAPSEDHLWAEHFDLALGDVLAVQEEIARRASEALQVELLSGESRALRAAGEGDFEAHFAYLKGRHFLNKPGREALDRAIRFFEEALRVDPKHARALTGLADAWCRMGTYTTAEEGYAKAREYVERALALDATLAEAHCSLATIAAGDARHFGEAEQLLRRAIELDPNCAAAHARLAGLLAATDRIEEGMEASKAALILDPLSASLNLLYADCLYEAARFQEAIEQAKWVIELDPELDSAWWTLWYSLGAIWDWDQAEASLHEMVDRHPRNPRAYVYLAMCVQCRGRLEEGVALMEKALSLPGAADDLTVAFYCGNGYYFARRFDVAEEFYRKVLERTPGLDGARVLLAKCLVHQQRFDEALDELDTAEKTYGITGEYWLSHARMERGRILVLRGETEKAEAQLALLMEGGGRQNRRLAVSVLLHVLGRVDEALDWAEDAVDAREPHVNAFRKAPEFPREMYEHPRFQALLERIGLAD